MYSTMAISAENSGGISIPAVSTIKDAVVTSGETYFIVDTTNLRRSPDTYGYNIGALLSMTLANTCLYDDANAITYGTGTAITSIVMAKVASSDLSFSIDTSYNSLNSVSYTATTLAGT